MIGSWTGSGSSSETLRLLAGVVLADATLSRFAPRLARLLTALVHWLLPWARRLLERLARVREELAAELGREPTYDEIHARLARDAEMHASTGMPWRMSTSA
jgi:hypothetical protein